MNESKNEKFLKSVGFGDPVDVVVVVAVPLVVLVVHFRVLANPRS